MKNITEKKIARLEYLGEKIGRYSHRWSESASNRLVGWVYEYNKIKEDYRDAFLEYCARKGFDKEHDGYDCLA